MKILDVKTPNDLWDFMTTSSDGLVDSVSRIKGRIIILGGSGKMGKELVGLIINADKKNGVEREIIVASTFSNPDSTDLEDFNNMGVKCYKGDLSDETFLASLPDAPNVVYMMGFKFGSSNDWRRAFHLNSVVPYLVGQKFKNSSIVVFSSGNPYPHTSRFGNGCCENCELSPVGIYGWSIIARESSFKTTALINDNQKISIYRLMYAQHLSYGVLVDLAKMVLNEEPISLGMPAVNLISQRDANEAALKSFEMCNKDGWVFNVAGTIWQVRDIVEKIGRVLNKNPRIVDEEAETALIADDTLCRDSLGAYQDDCEEFIEAAALWVKNNGNYWNKPTHFGKVRHDY